MQFHPPHMKKIKIFKFAEVAGNRISKNLISALNAGAL
jgi:hypothetical protein